MSKFTVRVEPYGQPSGSIYETLHEAMEKGGFTRKISFEKDGKTTTYWLPNAEYSIDGTQTPDDIKDKAVIVVKTVWVEFGVLVTKTDVARSAYNLKKVV